MLSFNKYNKKIKKIYNINSESTFRIELLKLSEECSELAASISAFFFKTTKREKRLNEVLEEYVDVLICTKLVELSIKENLTDKELKYINNRFKDKIKIMEFQRKNYEFPKI